MADQKIARCPYELLKHTSPRSPTMSKNRRENRRPKNRTMIGANALSIRVCMRKNCEFIADFKNDKVQRLRTSLLNLKSVQIKPVLPMFCYLGS